MILSSILIVIGFVLLIVGADLLVDGASGIAKNFHIPEIIIGLTIVSIGTSMPELFVSITSALDGYSDMAIGNIVGSNLINLLLILGLSATIKPVFFQKETRIYEIPMCLFVTGLLMYFCNTGTAKASIARPILNNNNSITPIFSLLFSHIKRLNCNLTDKSLNLYYINISLLILLY